MDTTQILKIQKELAQRTLVEPANRHKRLYRLVCDEGWLQAGLETVLSHQGSGTLPSSFLFLGTLAIQRRSLKPIPIVRTQLLPGDGYREVYHTFCNIVGSVISPPCQQGYDIFYPP